MKEQKFDLYKDDICLVLTLTYVLMARQLFVLVWYKSLIFVQSREMEKKHLCSLSVNIQKYVDS